MVEYSKDDKPELYWLSYKTQLIRCSPHHVRADFTAADTQLADAQEARREVATLRSRGMTRFLDLDKVNKRHHPDELNDDEMASGSEPDDDAGGGDDLQPPSRRQRTTYDMIPQDEPSFEEAMDQMQQQLDRERQQNQDDELYEPSLAPTSPADTPAEHPEFLAKHNLLFYLHHYWLLIQFHNPSALINIDEPEPNREPSTMATAPNTPMDTADPPPLQPPAVTSTDMNLYEPATAPDFLQRRRQMDRQETMQFGPFGPMRRRAAQRHAPYDQDPPEGEPPPGRRDPASELFGQAFTVSDIGGDHLPTGWSVDEEGYTSSLTPRTTMTTGRSALDASSDIIFNLGIDLTTSPRPRIALWS